MPAPTPDQQARAMLDAVTRQFHPDGWDGPAATEQRLRSVRFFTGRTMPQAAIDVGGDTFAEWLELIDAYLGSPNKPYAHLAHVAEGRTGQPWWMDGPHVPTSWWAGDPPPEALGSGTRSYAVSLEGLLVANSLGQAEAVARQFRR